jgi:hypothetical protein
MHAGASGSTVTARAETAHPVVYTTLYDLIAAVNDAVDPGEEDVVAPIVAHLLRAGRAHFLRDVDVDMLWDDQALGCLEDEESCVLV